MNSEDIETLVEKVGGTVEVITRKQDAWGFQDAWRRAFAADPDVWARTSAAEWEVIASGLVPAARGARAIDEWDRLLGESARAPSLDLVITRRLGVPPLFVVRGASELACLSAIEDFDGDLYVTEASFAWSLVRTHEEPRLGPFLLSGDSDPSSGASSS